MARRVMGRGGNKPSVDPYLNNVSLLLPMFGVNNGTVFTDYSPSPKTITRYGDAKTVTAQSKYYGSSGYFDGGGDYLSVASSAALKFGTGDFTVECWVKLPAYPGGGYLNDMTILGPASAATGAHILFVLNYANGAITAWNGSTGLTGVLALPLNAWTHIAWTRQSGVLRLFMNGVLDSSVSYPTNVTATTQWNLFGYAYNQLRFFPGWAQDLRITKGLARYTANFTPPSQLYLGL